MSDGNNGINRRNVLKSLGAGAAAFAAGSGNVTATENPQKEEIEILQNEKVQQALERAGDPEVT